MENFSNDLMENMAINALPDVWPKYKLRLITFDKITLSYQTEAHVWTFDFGHSPDLEIDDRFKKLFWSRNGEKEQIIDFLCKAKPDFERDFLRKKADLDFIEQKPSKILEAL